MHTVCAANVVLLLHIQRLLVSHLVLDHSAPSAVLMNFKIILQGVQTDCYNTVDHFLVLSGWVIDTLETSPSLTLCLWPMNDDYTYIMH